MSTVQLLRALVSERLTAAVEDIFGVLERTIVEYEETVSRSKEEISRQRKLLDAILKPEIPLKRADTQQLFVCKEEVPPEQQEWSPSLGQEEPEPPHIKEEQEKLTQEPEVTVLTLLPVKSDDNEEETSSQLNPTQSENREAEPPASTSTKHMKTEPDEEDCGLSEPASNFYPASDLEPTSDGQLFSSDCDGDWKETREGLNALKSTKTQRVKRQSLSVSKKFRSSMKLASELKPSNQVPTLVGCKVCGKSFPSKTSLMKHSLVHSSDCGLCGKHLEPRESGELHFQTHRISNVCSMKCSSVDDLEQHVQVHTRQKPFSCTFCKKGFDWNHTLREEMRVHAGKKRFSCAICSKGFNQKGHLNDHMRLHTGEKPFSCSVCGKSFVQKTTLKTHMRVHTGEKPFTCSACGKSFRWRSHYNKHKCVIENSSR
ncbi:uncharacterized protein ACJ7VT_010392 isoform 1-T2 [Polymixia lowei]